jgi:hypothetical protein
LKLSTRRAMERIAAQRSAAQHKPQRSVQRQQVHRSSSLHAAAVRPARCACLALQLAEET